jgi:nitroreductase
MELKRVTEVRRSIRRFKPDPLNAELILELLEAARLAPSGTNLQPWRFMAVTSPLMREKLAACTYHMSFVGQAPLTMVCCADFSSLGDRGRRIRELAAAGVFDGLDVEKITQTGHRQPNRNDAADLAYLNMNVAIAVEHMILRGTELGLGSCWVMMFSKKKVMELLELPETLHVLALVPFGYPDQSPAARPRLPLDAIFLGEV